MSSGVKRCREVFESFERSRLVSESREGVESVESPLRGFPLACICNTCDRCHKQHKTCDASIEHVWSMLWQLARLFRGQAHYPFTVDGEVFFDDGGIVSIVLEYE